MSIKSISKELCDGCGICLDSCATDVIRMGEDQKASIAYPEDCNGCFLCQMDCPQKAIYVTSETSLPVPVYEITDPILA